MKKLRVPANVQTELRRSRQASGGGSGRRACICSVLLLTVFGVCALSTAQITGSGLQQGEPIVTTSSTTANSSSVAVDATQFTGTSTHDLCDKVAAACSFGTNTLNPSVGMDVDARAFSSTLATSNTNQVCSVATANAMLTNCSNGGKVLLGSYTLWLPLSPATAVSSPNPPGAVLVLPNNFGGFRGISRGSLSCHDANANCSAANTPISTGTVIAACTGTNIPVSGCVAPSTSRKWTISSITGTSKPNTNYYAVTLNTGSATNLVPGEPVRIDNGSVAGFNGGWPTFALLAKVGSPKFIRHILLCDPMLDSDACLAI